MIESIRIFHMQGIYDYVLMIIEIGNKVGFIVLNVLMNCYRYLKSSSFNKERPFWSHFLVFFQGKSLQPLLPKHYCNYTFLLENESILL